VEPDRIFVSAEQRIVIEFHIGMLEIEEELKGHFDPRLWHWVPDLPSRWHPRKRARAIEAHKQRLADHVMIQWFGETRRSRANG
jgi:hypothetical protein